MTYLTAEQIATELQFTPAFVRKMAKAGKIPAVPFAFGKKTYYRFSLPEVVASLRGQ